MAQPARVGADVTATETARARLVDALTTAFVPLPVAATRPLDLAAPAVYVDVGSWDDVTDVVPQIVVTFPVVVVVDGSDEAQTLALDRYGDTVWTVAAEIGGRPSTGRPDIVNTSGPRLRTLTVDVALTVGLNTFCLTDLTTEGVSRG